MKNFSTQIIDALTARYAEVQSDDTLKAISSAKRCSAGLDMVMSYPCFKEVRSKLIKSCRVADNKDDKLNYVAVKVLVKIISTLQAIAVKMPSDLDPYTRTIGANLCKLNGVSNKTNLVCLSKSIEYSALDSTQAIARRYDCSPATASTQSSSTRMTLNYLGICDVVKGRQGDIMTLCDNERARQFVAIFSDKAIAEEQQPKAE
jgi:hypothetical protein